MRRVWAPVVFLVLGVLGGVAIALGFASDHRSWATTQNAEVWAPTYQVTSVQQGVVTAWRDGVPGRMVDAGARLGEVESRTGKVALRAPHAGTLVGDFGYQGDLVQPGQEIGLVADLRRPYVIAYVDESDAGKLAVGQRADVTFASDPKTSVGGRLARVYPAVASIVWPLPTVSGGTFSKSAQWVPVRIDFPQGTHVPHYLGMSASVRISIGGGGS